MQDPIPAQANVRTADLVARADGSSITAGTINLYVIANTGANAGKWFRTSDDSWQAAEAIAGVMAHKADGHWQVSVDTACWIDGVEYTIYAKESGDLHTPVSENVRCHYALAIDSGGTVAADVVEVSGDSGAADNMELDYDGTGYTKANSTIGTCTTNTDMVSEPPTANEVRDAILDDATRFSGADIATILTDTNELQADWTDGGRLDLLLDSVIASELVARGVIFAGVVTGIPNGNQFVIQTLAGLGAGAFMDATSPWCAYVFRDNGGAGAAPQGEFQPVTGYVTATGSFTTTAFTAAVAIGDDIILINPRLADVGTLKTKTDAILADTNELQTDDIPGLIAALNDLAQADILSDATPFAGATINDWTDGGRLDLLLDAIKAVTDALPDAGALNDLALILTDTNELQTDWADGGRLDLLLDAIKAVTDLLPDGGALNDLAILEARLTAIRAGYLDELAAANMPADLDMVNTHTTFTFDIEGGRWRIVFNAPNWQQVFYEDDNLTEVARFNLLDAGGNPANPATTAIVERVRV